VEKAPSTGQVHLQGYVALLKKQRFSAVKRLLGDDTIHLDRVTTTPDRAAAYCKKEDSRIAGPWEWGKAPDKRGKKSALEDAIKDIKEGKPMAEVAASHSSVWVHSNRGLKDLRSQLTKPHGFIKPVTVTVYWGPTRTGKTYRAMSDSCADGRTPYKMPLSDGFWFDGYDGEDTLVIDDFYGQIAFSKMLLLLDDKHVQVPVKGGFTWAAWNKVYITSNSHPDDWWKEARQSIPAASMEAMMARLHVIELMATRWNAAVSPTPDADADSLMPAAPAAPTTTVPDLPPPSPLHDYVPPVLNVVNPRGDFSFRVSRVPVNKSL